MLHVSDGRGSDRGWELSSNSSILAAGTRSAIDVVLHVGYENRQSMRSRPFRAFATRRRDRRVKQLRGAGVALGSGLAEVSSPVDGSHRPNAAHPVRKVFAIAATDAA